MGGTGTLWKADALLLLTAVIWGFTLVAQRGAMASMGPSSYSAVRFGLGTLVLAPVLAVARIRSGRTSAFVRSAAAARLGWSAAAGALLFLGADIQQLGLVHTTAGNAGFITSIYVVLVPLLGVCFGQPGSWRIWSGALAALAGLYVLCVRPGFVLALGDLLALVSALFWAGYVLLVGHLARRMEALELAVGQAAFCGLYSLVAALATERAPFAGVGATVVPLLVGGPLSIGVGYTLQIFGQRWAHPAHAAIIMSMEALFAALGGALFLGEPVTVRLVLGGALMFTGLLLSQALPRNQPEPAPGKGTAASSEPSCTAPPRTIK